ncbi:cation:proton antiporter [Egicoccus halophilus]|uniref:Cation:proton antiporter n=2 Tax=Egicoccus halophilus TaxID=1670830 RepID=A0A8J3AE24_9ACTN|nr:cation:proton antiporter [Egicoccus halophilus]
MLLVSTPLIVLGMLFLIASTVGLLKLPDLYTRAHAVAKSETLGLLLLFVGLLFRPELEIDASFRLAFVLVASLILNPTAVHALVRAAHRSGALPVQTVDQQAAETEITEALGGPPGPHGPHGPDDEEERA